MNIGYFNIAPTQPIAVIGRKIKHKLIKKDSTFPLSLITSLRPPLGGLPLETIQPLATWTEAWKAIPGVSNWVLGIIKWGYTLHFARRPLQFGGVVSTSVQQDWFFSLDLKDAYFHIQIAPQHRRFLWFAFVGVAYQYTVLLFGLSLAPLTFTKPGAETDGNPHPELPQRLAHFGPVGGRVSISQIRAPQPLRVPRTLGQFCQDCTVPQPTNFVPGNSYRLNVSHQNLHWPFSSSRLHSNGVPQPLKAFQRMLGLMASASSVLHLGLLHMQPLQYWLKPRVPSQTPPCQGEPGLRCSSGPYKNHQWMERCVPLGMDYRRKVVSTDASNLGWGALCDSKPAFGLWSKKEGHIHINRLEMLAVCLSLRTFLSDLNGHHVLVQYFYFIWWMYT